MHVHVHLHVCTVGHIPMRVLPVPGGPNSRIPLGGPLRPLNMSLYVRGTQ